VKAAPEKRYVSGPATAPATPGVLDREVLDPEYDVEQEDTRISPSPYIDIAAVINRCGCMFPFILSATTRTI
jgi:hypothetical protein